MGKTFRKHVISDDLWRKHFESMWFLMIDGFIIILG